MLYIVVIFESCIFDDITMYVHMYIVVLVVLLN